jgi:hypothetical protein
MTNEKARLDQESVKDSWSKRASSLQFAQMHAHLGELQACICHLSLKELRATLGDERFQASHSRFIAG